jgi:benzoate-CoA ligase family protein
VAEADLRFPNPMNAASLFVDRNVEEGRGDQLAILCQDKQLTYGQVLEMVNRTANVLLGLGLQPEQRVLMLVLDGPEFAATFFGAIKAGIVPVPVNTNLRAGDYRYMLNDSRAPVAVISASLLTEIEPIVKDARYLRHLVVIDGAPLASDGGVARHDYKTLLAAATGEREPEPRSPDDVAFWLYSSGTTGTPKAAVHLQHDMIVCCESYARQVLQISASDRTYSVAKLFFAYGLGNALYFPFWVGASTVLDPGKPDPRRVLDNVARYRPTLFFSVPTSYAAMLAISDARATLASVRSCVSAGEALPAPIYQRWRDRYSVEILDGIGSTEVLHIFISNRPGQVRPGSSGTVVPGYEARIVDDVDRRVPDGEIGNLLIKGDSTCAYYWNQHEKTKQTIQGEWIRTGDKYIRDLEGYFWYAGRTDDMLKVSGQWVSPVEVEAALIEHPAVLESAVIGLADSEGLVKPKAFVVLREGQAPSDALGTELQEFVKARIAAYKYPRWIEFVTQVPKTATGKIQRYKLREREATPARPPVEVS